MNSNLLPTYTDIFIKWYPVTHMGIRRILKIKPSKIKLSNPSHAIDAFNAVKDTCISPGKYVNDFRIHLLSDVDRPLITIESMIEETLDDHVSTARLDFSR